jgi:SAM-dependent methyltransferase
MDCQQLAGAWTRLMAPDSGDVRAALVQEAAEFLGLSRDDAWQRLQGAGLRFRDEWARAIENPADHARVTAFYNQSDTELFELIEWHASDPIHYRTLIVRDLALASAGRLCLDYGSGIGSDALVFGQAGFTVTLADISDCLLAFAAFRCRKRGIAVRTIDLKRESLPEGAFDVVLCLDVLEHIPEPLPVVRTIRRAMREQGTLVIHAPFGDDPEHPMHVVHHDVVTPQMRSLGFQPVDCFFPPEVRAPQVYRKTRVAALDRAAYYVYDGYLRNAIGARLASWYRTAFRRRSRGLARLDA